MMLEISRYQLFANRRTTWESRMAAAWLSTNSWKPATSWEDWILNLSRCICRYELMGRAPSIQGDRLRGLCAWGRVLSNRFWCPQVSGCQLSSGHPDTMKPQPILSNNCVSKGLACLVFCSIGFAVSEGTFCCNLFVCVKINGILYLLVVFINLSSYSCNVDSWGNRVTISSSKSVTLV